MITIVSM